MQPFITLWDGVVLNSENPSTFEIPTPDEKAALVPGDFVKLGFSCPKEHKRPGVSDRITGERMWVLVTGDGVGDLNNDPVVMPLKDGDPIKFEPRHILSIIKRGE